MTMGNEELKVQGVLITELLESQRKQIEAENRRADLEQKKVEYQIRLVERQEQYNSILSKLYEITKQIKEEIDQVPPFLATANSNLQTLVTVIEQVCAMLVFKNKDIEEISTLKKIQNGLEQIKNNPTPAPQIKIVGSVNAGQDANIESTLNKINEPTIPVDLPLE